MRKKIVFFQIILALFVKSLFGQSVTLDPPEAHICSMEQVQLTASGALFYRWNSQQNFIEDSTIVVSPNTTTTYTVEGYNLSDTELIVNSDFEMGNTGFSSDYTYVTGMNNMFFGSYTINSDGASVWPSGGHIYGYGGSGLFMIVDGAETPNSVIWEQTVNVTPNTHYSFSSQVVSMFHSYLVGKQALLQFSVNGILLGEVFHSPDVLNVWVQYYELWYSGSATTATLTIVNQNADGAGNDFGLDNISFRELEYVGEAQSVVNVHSSYEPIDFFESACDQFVWYDQTYTVSGQYEHTVINNNGCDSIYILNLTINNSDTTYLDVSSCEEYLFCNTIYYQSGIYQQMLQTSQGCDSIVNLNLTINHSDTMSFIVSACENYTWNEQTYTSSGNYTYTTINEFGCNRTEILNLDITSSNVFIQGKTSVYPSTDITSGIYQYYIDSTGINPANVHWSIDREDWLLFPNGASCDLLCSSAGRGILHAWTEGESCDVDTTLIINAAFYGTEENEAETVAIYPNPTNSSVTVSWQGIVSIKVYNMFGQNVNEYKFANQDKIILDMQNYQKGVYVLEISSSNGKVYRSVVLTE